MKKTTLLKYFKHIKLSKEVKALLPKPDGPLARLIPCSKIELLADSPIREIFTNAWALLYQ